MMRPERSQGVCLVVIMGWILLTVGCGQKSVTVSGTITWDGKPAESGTISFGPVSGAGASFGGEIKDGKYRVKGAAKTAHGKTTATIVALRKTGRKTEAGPPAPPGTLVDDLDRVVSTETCEIAKGKDTQQNFDLKSPAVNKSSAVKR
jgi:hypothetical protein